MATGTATRRRAPPRGLRLEYEGKRPEAEVLSRSPADLVLCRPGIAPGANRLYLADNAGVLAALLRDGEVAGRVRLVYIDPPFATQAVYHSRRRPAYDDLLEGAAYVEALRERLLLLRELLAPDGSLYLHLGPEMVFPIKLVLDEVFGPAGFRNCIVRKKCHAKNYTRSRYGNVTDYILYYGRGPDPLWQRPLEAWSGERAREYRATEPGTGRRYMLVPLHAPGVRKGDTGTPWRGRPPPPGKHWQYPPAALDEMDRRGEIAWSRRGNPRRKVFLDKSPGVPVTDLWLDCKDAHNQNVPVTGYPTEKNPALLRRIVAASSAPGDLVLDCYAGSGTTLAVAGALGRRWIGVDRSPEAIRSTLRRLGRGPAPMGDFVRPVPDDAPELPFMDGPLDCDLYAERGLAPLLGEP